MLTHDNLLRIARRYDTLMARAMLRALGYAKPLRGPSRGRGGRPTPTAAALLERRRYSGMGWCFANHGSPMDGR